MDSGLCTTATQKICINLQLLLEETNHEIWVTDAGRAWGKGQYLQVNQKLLCLEVTGKKNCWCCFYETCNFPSPLPCLKSLIGHSWWRCKPSSRLRLLFPKVTDFTLILCIVLENLRRGTLIACDCNWLHDGCQAISGWEHTPQNSCQTRHLAQSHQVSAPCSEQEWHFLCPPRLCSARQISWHNDSQKGLIWISFSWCKVKMQTWTALLAESWSQIPKEKRALLDLRPWRDHCGITDTAQPFLVQGCFKKAKIKAENQWTVSRSTWSNWY